jgi:hypothetical protein
MARIQRTVATEVQTHDVQSAIFKALDITFDIQEEQTITYKR